MKLVPNRVTRAAAKAAFKTSKHSPTILFVAGVVGFGTTVVLAARATLKLEDEVLVPAQKRLQWIDEHVPESENHHIQAKVHCFGEAGWNITKLYAPAAIAGVTTLACFTQSHRILTKRNAVLGLAYAGMEKAFREYRERVRQEIGDENERRLYSSAREVEIVESTKSGDRVRTITRHGDSPLSPYAVLFDSDNANWQVAQEFRFLHLKATQKWCNRILQRDGHIFLNQVYDELGFPHTSNGSRVGWLLKQDGGVDGYVDFGFEDPERTDKFLDFVLGREGAVWLDFNVDGEIWDKI